MDVMLDLETMSSKNNASIIAIGAIHFDPKSNIRYDSPYDYEYFYANVSLASSMLAGLDVSAKTIMWWLQQSEEARQSLIDPQPIELQKVLKAFSGWFPDPDNTRIWAHATFDLPILSYAYEACGLQQPYKYINERDVRTIYNLAYPGGRPPIPEASKHNALYDAWRQSIGVQECYAKLS